MSSPLPSSITQPSTPNSDTTNRLHFLHKTLIQIVAVNALKLEEDLGDTELARAIVVTALEMIINQLRNNDIGDLQSCTCESEGLADVYGRQPSSQDESRGDLEEEEPAPDLGLITRTMDDLDKVFGTMGERIDGILEETKSFNAALNKFITDMKANHEQVE